MFSIMFVSCMFVLEYSFNTVFINIYYSMLQCQFVYKYLLQHASMSIYYSMLQCQFIFHINYFTWRTDIFPLLGIFTCCTFFWKVHIFISRKEWIDSINYLIKTSIFLVFIFELAIPTLSVDREHGEKRNQSRGIQFIHAKRLTHHPNTRYTLLVMDSCYHRVCIC